MSGMSAMPVQVFPTGPTAPPPPPPQPKNQLAPQNNTNGRKSPAQNFEPPPFGFRPEIKIPTNPMATLKPTPKPEIREFWKEEYIKDKSPINNEPQTQNGNEKSFDQIDCSRNNKEISPEKIKSPIHSVQPPRQIYSPQINQSPISYNDAHSNLSSERKSPVRGVSPIRVQQQQNRAPSPVRPLQQNNRIMNQNIGGQQQRGSSPGKAPGLLPKPLSPIRLQNMPVRTQQQPQSHLQQRAVSPVKKNRSPSPPQKNVCRILLVIHSSSFFCKFFFLSNFLLLNNFRHNWVLYTYHQLLLKIYHRMYNNLGLFDQKIHQMSYYRHQHGWHQKIIQMNHLNGFIKMI